MKIAIRMDDIAPDMNWKRFTEFKELLDEHGIKPLMGVVPDNQDDNLSYKEDNKRWLTERDSEESCILKEKEGFWQYVRKLQENGWIVALHGYRHVYSQNKGGMFPLNHFSEFAGVPLDEQQKMLEAGKAILLSHGIETDIFMAPGHSYDKNTLKALKKTGFVRLTDGFGRKPYMWEGITFYPISFRLGSSLKKRNGYTTMVVHTNTMTEADMERYRKILSGKEVISYCDYLRQPASRRGIFGRAGEYILANIKHMLVGISG